MINQKILSIEEKARELNRKIFAIQEFRIDVTVFLAIARIEFRESEEVLDLEVVENDLALRNQEIGLCVSEIEKLNVLLESEIDKLENI